MSVKRRLGKRTAYASRGTRGKGVFYGAGEGLRRGSGGKRAVRTGVAIPAREVLSLTSKGLWPSRCRVFY